MILFVLLLGLIGLVPFGQGDTGTGVTEGLKVDGTQTTQVDELLKLRAAMTLELEKAEQEYEDCEEDPIAWPDVQYARGQLDGFKRVLARLKITLPGGEVDDVGV